LATLMMYSTSKPLDKHQPPSVACSFCVLIYWTPE
jgi:hypothetical protein